MNKEAAPHEWSEGTIGTIATVNPSVSVASLDRDAIVSFLTMADVSESGRILNHQVRPLQQVRSGFTRFLDEDTLFAKITPCMENGKGAIATNLANGHGFGSTEFHVLRANELGEPRFLYHLSLSKEVRTKALAFFTGSAGQQRVDPQFFHRFPLLIPPLGQQRKIALILTTLDELIEKTEALIAKYQAAKQGMMHDLFTRGVDEHGQLRRTCDEAPELYKESELGWIPREWKEDSLGNICIWMSGGTPSKSNAQFWTGNIPWVSPKDMKVFELSDAEDHITEEAARTGSRLVPAGTVLIVIRGMILAHSFPVAITTREVTFNQDMKALTFEDTSAARFAAHWFVSNKAKMIAIATESTHGTKRFDLSDVYAIPIGLPHSEETARIVAILDSFDAKQSTENERLEKLRFQKSGLMQDLLTGNVRVKVNEEDGNV